MSTGILFFKDEEGSQCSLAVDAPTRIGRSQQSWNYTDRTMPVDISGVCNQLIIRDISVSRNHALVWPVSDKGIIYLIQDLDTKNGTNIIRQNEVIAVSSEFPTPLVNNDKIKIGDTEIAFELRERTLSRQALIIATDPYNKLEVERDAVLVKDLLISLGFEEKNIARLSGPNVTKDNVWQELSRLAKESTEQSLIVVHYSGHGSPNGELVVKEPGPKLTAPNLEPLFRAIKGNKIVIFDCCFAKKFKPAFTGIERCAFLGASQENEAAYENAKKGGVFTRAVVNALKNALSKNNNYVRITEIAEVKGFNTGYNPGAQNFTMYGAVCFTKQP